MAWPPASRLLRGPLGDRLLPRRRLAGRLRAVAFLTAVVSPSSGGGGRLHHGQRVLGSRVARQPGGHLPRPAGRRCLAAGRRLGGGLTSRPQRLETAVSVAAYTSSASRRRSSSARHSASPRRFSEIRRSRLAGLREGGDCAVRADQVDRAALAVQPHADHAGAALRADARRTGALSRSPATPRAARSTASRWRPPRPPR